MTTWLDVVLIDGESELRAKLDGLGGDARAKLAAELSAVIGSTPEQVEYGVLRVLIERARPFALSKSMWTRSPVSSDPIAPLAEAHLEDILAGRTDDRVRAMTDLYSRFGTTRPKYIAIEPLLRRQNFHCALCGLRYYNQDLEALAIVSPLGYRASDKSDGLKPHWETVAFRRPRADHIWPVSMYGDNRSDNLQAICDACNEGKANLTFLSQSPRYVGITAQAELAGAATRLTKATFVAQLWRSPRCVETGLGPDDTELTVRIRNPKKPLVIDNLETIASPE